MKFTILSFLFLAAIVSFTSCKDEKKAETAPAATETPTQVAPTATDNQTVPTPTDNQAAPAIQQAAEPPQNAKGVWHFTCAKGCAGGAGTQGTCAKCGGPLQHNPAYHAQ